MKTLIFNGSPRKNGETAYMIRTLQENLGGDFKVVNAYRADIRPCMDCRWCFDHAGCAVKDEWQEVRTLKNVTILLWHLLYILRRLRECFLL